jgi:hypothetical protein
VPTSWAVDRVHSRVSRPAGLHQRPLAEPDGNLWLANCYFAHDSSGLRVLLPFFDASSGGSFHPFTCYLVRLLGPGGVRSLLAESLLLKHQLLIVNRSRQRSPNLSASDLILAGLLALFVRTTRLLRSAIVLKPSTLLGLHKAMSKQKYQMLFSFRAGLPSAIRCAMCGQPQLGLRCFISTTA